MARQRLGKTQARALMAELIDVRDHLTRIISDLDKDADAPGRQMRDYDMPQPDPDEIARRYGVPTPPPENPMPTWFQERFGNHLTAKEPTE